PVVGDPVHNGVSVPPELLGGHVRRLLDHEPERNPVHCWLVTALRIGLLGAARIAPNALLRPARAVDSVRVTAVAARDPARAAALARKWGVPTVHPDYAALIADPDLDAVYNPLPNGLHAEWTLRALAAGKHVLCEKPFTANADEAVTVRDAADGTGLVV